MRVGLLCLMEEIMLHNKFKLTAISASVALWQSANIIDFAVPEIKVVKRRIESLVFNLTDSIIREGGA